VGHHVKSRCLRDVWSPSTALSMSSVHHQSQSRDDSSQKKGSRRRNENNVIYANPLPISFSPIENRFTVTALGIFGVSPTRVLNPRCEGTFDPTTRSVWVTNRRDSMVLWRRGFFGKGNLSRSEPSWLARQSHVGTASARRKPRLYLLVVT
jgi:tRNA-splicing endonuclease subunit Sen2